MVYGVAFGAYVLSVAFGPYLTPPGAIEVPTDFFMVYLVCCAPLPCGLGCGLGCSG
jgi:hypothetical protein